MTIFVFSIVGLGHVGCRSSHSDSESSRQRSLATPKPAPPDTPSVYDKHDLPPSRASKPLPAAQLAAAASASSDRLAATAPADGCNPCGSNSPSINAFPFNGLHVDGRANADGDRLVVDSFDRGTSHCDPGHKDRLFLRLAPRSEVVRKNIAGKDGKPVVQDVLVIDNPTQAGYELVAAGGPTAAPRCRGPELAGTTFEISSPQGQVKLLISHVAETSLRYATLPRPAPGEPLSKFFLGLSKNRDFLQLAGKLRQDRSQLRDDPTVHDSSLVVHQKRTIYLITRADHPNESLCTPNDYTEHAASLSKAPNPDSNDVPHAMPQVYVDHPLWRVMKDELPSYAVIIPGTVFDNKGDESANSRDPGWFNIACAADALAETDLSGLVPPPATLSETENKSSTALRLPALHMFSAKYADGVSATNNGTPISWKVVWSSKTSISIDLLDQQLQQLQVDRDRWLRSRDFSSVGQDSWKSDDPAAAAQPRAGTPDDHPMVEARWNARGAACLCHSRIWMANRVIPVPEQARKRLRAALDQTHVAPDLRDEGKFNGSLGAIEPCDVARIERAMMQPQPELGSHLGSDQDHSPELISFVLGHTSHDAGSNPDPCAAGQSRGN